MSLNHPPSFQVAYYVKYNLPENVQLGSSVLDGKSWYNYQNCSGMIFIIISGTSRSNISHCLIIKWVLI